MPEVFGEIADAARGVHQQVANGELSASTAEPVSASAMSDDELICAVVTDARVSSIQIDAYLMDTTPWRRLEPRVCEVVNAAFSAYELASMEELKKVNADFGDLVTKLGLLQGDIEAAYSNDLRRLGGGPT